MSEYVRPRKEFGSVYEYFEAQGYDVKVTDTKDGTIIFIKEKK